MNILENFFISPHLPKFAVYHKYSTTVGTYQLDLSIIVTYWNMWFVCDAVRDVRKRARIQHLCVIHCTYSFLYAVLIYVYVVLIIYCNVLILLMMMLNAGD
jgi:hypothetical protein